MNYIIKKVINKPRINFNNYVVYNLICSRNTFYIRKTSRNFKIRYN